MSKIPFRTIYKVVKNVEKTNYKVKLPQKSFNLVSNYGRSKSSVVQYTLLLPSPSELARSCHFSYLIYNNSLLNRFYPRGTYFPKSFSFVVTVDKVTYVVFRGTEVTNYLDIVTDLYATKVHPFGKEKGILHEGFFHRSRIDFGISINAKEDKYDEGSILDLIGKSEGEKLIFTGHSLGGAAAELSFLRYITFCENFPSNIASQFKDKSSFIVYGTPINTSIEIRKRFEKYSNQMHSIEQYNDPIVEIVRDLERNSEDADENYTGLFPFNFDEYISEFCLTSKNEILDYLKKKLSEKQKALKKSKINLPTKTKMNKFITFFDRIIELFRKLFHYNERRKKKKNEEYINDLVVLCNGLSNGLLDVTKMMNEMKEKFSKVTTDYTINELFSYGNKKSNENIESEKKVLYEDNYLKSFGESIKKIMENTINDISDLLKKADDIFIINTHNNNLKETSKSKIGDSKNKEIEESFKEYLITTIMIYRNEFEKNINKLFETQKDKSTEKLEERTTNYIDELIDSINLIINYFYLIIKNLNLSPEFIMKSIDTIQQTIQRTNFSMSTLIPVYEPISLPLGIHHIIMKDENLLNTTDTHVICEIYKRYRADSDPDMHRMRNYAIFINDLNYSK